MKKLFFALFLMLSFSYANANTSVYDNSYDFLKSEWLTCKMATDWCNSVSIIDWKLGAMTMMYCENIYWPTWKEQWKCLDEKLENDKLWFLSQNDRNLYNRLKNQLWLNLSTRIEKIISIFWEKVLENKKYNMTKSIMRIDDAISAFEKAIYNLTMTYPADTAISKSDTKKYFILELAKFELKIMNNRWKVNSWI